MKKRGGAHPKDCLCDFCGKSLEARARRRASATLQWATKREKMLKALANAFVRPEYRAARSAAAKAQWARGELLPGLRSQMPNNPKRAAARRAVWRRPGYKERTMAATLKALLARPTKPEAVMAGILGDEFEYTGNGKTWIAGMNPDFVHRSRPLVVEVFGDYWHRGQDPAERVARFEAAGYACAVFWEHELG